ncbi:MAG: MoaD/ThiS family protein [Candidatus Bathyarchaeota archaeon]|jgi:molybdopterin converting factor small subunit
MVRVTVKILGVAKEAAGTGEGVLKLPEGTDISTALGTLFKDYGEGLRDAILDPITGTPVATLILVNGIEIGNLEGLNTLLSDGDNLVLLSVTHGG